MQSFKYIHIGSYIQQKSLENNLDINRLCKFFNVDEESIFAMYDQNSLDSELLLKWCKILKYDFFRLYSQHLILYSPQGHQDCYNLPEAKNNHLPQFRKNIYTKEIIDFILKQINNGSMTKSQIIDEYRIPKTTLYKWIKKYSVINK